MYTVKYSTAIFSDATEIKKDERKNYRNQGTKEEKEEAKEDTKTTPKAKKDIFRPYCLKDPDIKPYSPFSLKVQTSNYIMSQWQWHFF